MHSAFSTLINEWMIQRYLNILHYGLFDYDWNLSSSLHYSCNVSSFNHFYMIFDIYLQTLICLNTYIHTYPFLNYNYYYNYLQFAGETYTQVVETQVESTRREIKSYSMTHDLDVNRNSPGLRQCTMIWIINMKISFNWIGSVPGIIINKWKSQIRQALNSNGKLWVQYLQKKLRIIILFWFWNLPAYILSKLSRR